MKPLEIHAHARICEETHDDYCGGGYSTLVVQVKRGERWEEVGHYCVVEDVAREAQTLRRAFVAVVEETPDVWFSAPACAPGYYAGHDGCRYRLDKGGKWFLWYEVDKRWGSWESPHRDEPLRRIELDDVGIVDLGAETVDRRRLAALAAETRATLRELPQDVPARQVEAILCGVLEEIERLSS